MTGAAASADVCLRRGEALAELLRMLLCGEESAAVAFDILGRRRQRCGDPRELADRLTAIAAEEREHERLLLNRLESLPQSAVAAPGYTSASQFFRQLASRDAGVHFSRIAALDSAVCLLLTSLRRAQPQLYCPTLARIARDEARHAALAGHYARRLCAQPARADAAAETRFGLASLLSERAAALDTLAIDPDQLLQRLRLVPRLLHT